MKLSKTIKSFSIEDSNIIKGVGILLIVFHNFFHWTAPFAKENEFDFNLKGVLDLINGIKYQPLDSINLLFSFWGHYGVQLFIFISGYGLMRAYQNKNIKWRGFVSKRINKLWPTFFFALFVFYSLFRLFYFQFSIGFEVLGAYLLKILFVANFFPDEVFSLNGPWWFYSMIVQLYIVFPILLWFQRKYGNIALVIISIVSYLIIYTLNPWFVEHSSSLYYFFLGNVPVFSLGIALASKERFRYNHFIGLGALILFSLGNFFLPFWYISHLMFTIISVVFLYFFLIRKNKSSYIHKTLLFFGEISMYLFAIHGFLRYPFIKLAKDFNNPLLKLLWAISFILLAIITAFLLKWVVNNYMKVLHFLSNKVQKISSKFVLFTLNSINSLFQIGVSFILILILLRTYEFTLLQSHHELPEIWHQLLLSIVFNDALIGIGFLGILIFPYLLIFRISKPVAKTLTIIFFNLIIISSIMLIQYFDLTLIPLDRVIYAYSWESIMELSKTADFNIVNILPFILGILIFNLSLIFSSKIAFKRLFIIVMGIISLFIAITHNKLLPKEHEYKTEQDYLYSYNKLIYFVKDIIRYDPSDGFDISEVGASTVGYRKTFRNRKYLSFNYPFLRKPDQGDPLGSFFNKTKDGRKPNIVFIIVESLCTPISGPYAYKSSFTPFLDSLTEQSLYWRNNLSTSERTFGVLPAVFGSLPYGKKGFLDLNLDMPKHKSLINILGENGYSSRFFYGGWTHFNNMDVYMKLNNIDTIINNFNHEDSIPPNKNDFSWGYSDRAIFQSTFKTIPDSTNPYLSIYLTLSTHSPFMLKNSDYYEQMVIDRINKLNISEKDRPGYILNKQKLATFLFFDDELRKFFKNYKKRKDFDNTIFIITGDHRGIIFYRNSQIDVYHTPLIIYSPLLKEAKEFGGISSHADITPTFLNYLENNYQITSPKQVSWQGGILDTATNFHSQQHMAFMRNNRDIRDYISGNYYLATDNLYEIHDTLHLQKIEDATIKNRLKQELKNYKNLNRFSIMGLQKQTKNKLVRIDSNYFDFEKSTPLFFKNDTTSKESYSGAHSVILRKNQEYGSIFPSIILSEGISRLYVDISFKVLISTFGSQNPTLVLSTTRDNESINWVSVDFMNNNFGTDKVWKNVKISKTLFLDPNDSKGLKLKLYLWNRHGCEMFYDDIKVIIKAKKK